VTIELIDKYEDFLRLEPVWNNLLKRSSIDNPFSLFEWNRAWLETFGDELEIFIIGVKDGEAIIGIAPLCVRKKGALTFIGHPQNDYAGFILDSDRPDAMARIVQYLKSAGNRWNKIILDQFPEGSGQADFVLNVLADAELPHRAEPSDICPAMILDDKEAARKMYYKRNIASYINWFKKEGDFRYNIYVDIDVALARLDDLFAQHIGRWRGTSTPSYFADEKMRRFYKRFFTLMFPRGWIQFSSLTLDDKYLALYISFEYNNKLYLYKTSYNPEYAKKSPGQAILRYLFDYALEKNIGELDFARGDEGYKGRFANAVRRNRRLIIYKSGLSKMAADAFYAARYSKTADILYRNKPVQRLKKNLLKLLKIK
jgi:CelD/BcsL family acetyltransferase involved in cellulose biosynthesis